MGSFLTRGQDAAVAAVARHIAAERPPHALLLVGPAGVGKTTLALDLAAGLVCLADDPGARPCRGCAACRKLVHGNHPDLHRLAPEGAGGQIKLGQVQSLQSALALMPAEGRFRIAIVEAAHRLNPDAQNAFLKTLEEPPARVSLILCVDDETPILPTVRSRCARLRLAQLSIEAMTALIVERGVADASRAATVARLAAGRPGIALALASEPEAMLIEARLARASLDLVRADRRERLGAITPLLTDAAAYLEAVERGAAAAERLRDGDGSVDSARPTERPARGGAEPDGASESDDEQAGADPEPRPTKGRAMQPAQRRQAALRLLSLWRDLGRDLALAAAGARAEIARLDLVEELERAAVGVDRGGIATFLARVDALAGAIDAYANPDLVVDVLALAWPHASGVSVAA